MILGMDTSPAFFNQPVEQALFNGQIQGLIVTLYQNERPPFGLSGILDWYFQGAISHSIKAGAITGTIGECTYFPYLRNETTHHVLLVGAGDSLFPGQRKEVPPVALEKLRNNLISLKLAKIGLSRADFGSVEMNFFKKYLSGVSLWIAP